MEATTKALRLHTRELLSAVDRGERVFITWHGRRRAMLAPLIEEAPHRTGRNPAFGIWRDREDDVDTQVRTLRARRELP